MMLDQKALASAKVAHDEAADTFSALHMTLSRKSWQECHGEKTPADLALESALTAYLALASRSSAIVEEPMAECRLVPVEPTEAMLEAYQGALRRYIEALPPEAKTKGSFGGYWVPAKHKARVRWAAMLAASPSLNAALTVEPEAGEVIRK